MNATESVIERFNSIVPTTLVQPRDYQGRLVSKAIGFRMQGVKSVMLNSPTGSGKTVMGLMGCRLLQDYDPDCGILWVAMRRTLLNQAARENTEKQIGAHIRFMSMFDRTIPLEDEDGRPIKVIIIDEAQHDAANTMATIHNLVRPEFVLGMTATPYRSDRVKLCFQKQIRDIGIRQLVDMGYLAQYHHYTIPEWSVDQVVDTYLRCPSRWGKSAMYWHQREDAIECCERLKAGGVRCETVFGDQPQRLREERLESFDKGELDVLVNMVLLTEGWDCPTLKTAFVRDSVKGPTIQMAGRVFRKHEGAPIKQIVQSKLTHYPLTREVDPAESFVWMDDDWRSCKPSKDIERVACNALMAMIQANVELPSFLLKQADKQPRRRGDGDRLDGTAPRNDFRANGGGFFGGGDGAFIH